MHPFQTGSLLMLSAWQLRNGFEIGVNHIISILDLADLEIKRYGAVLC